MQEIAKLCWHQRFETLCLENKKAKVLSLLEEKSNSL